MRFAEALLVVGLWVAALVWGVRAVAVRVLRARRAHEPWRVTKHPTRNGGMTVCVERPGEKRVVRTLPPAPTLDQTDYQSDLLLAIEAAKQEAEVLNKP